MKTILFGSAQIRQNIHTTVKTSQRSMASEKKIFKQNSLNSSERKPRVCSFVKDEDMERILQEIDSRNKYNPSSKYAKKRESIPDGGEIAPDEELNQFFVDVEKRNSELQELLQAIESSAEESDGQQSRISSAGVRGSTDSLVEKLMEELDDVDCEKEELNWKLKQPNCSNKTKSCSKLEASASEEELDQMLAELLDL